MLLLCVLCLKNDDTKFFPSFFFSYLFPLSGFFFLVKIIDLSKTYKPSSKIILDIPTAANFFYVNPSLTKQKVGAEVRRLVKAWNAEYEEKPNVSYYLFFANFTNKLSLFN
jgi:hypothetical protein